MQAITTCLHKLVYHTGSFHFIISGVACMVDANVPLTIHDEIMGTMPCTKCDKNFQNFVVTIYGQGI